MATSTPVDLTAASLARSWYVDVNTGTHASPTWSPVSGVMEVSPDTPATMKEVSVASDGGATSSQKTAHGWGLKMKLRRAATLDDTSTYDVGQEKLRTLSLALGAANLAEIRYYEVNGDAYPLGEAWQGYASVQWGEANAAVDDPRVIEVTLTGFGARTAISPHPASA
jgi:hypothetical protein